jgi:type II secretion system protein J
VLLALFIFAIVIVIISTSLIQLLNNTNIMRDKQSRLVDIQSMLAMIQFDLSQVINVNENANQGQIQGSFYSKDNALHFYKMGNVNPNFSYNRTSLEEVEYRLEQDKLLRFSKDSDETRFYKQVLIDKVTSIQWQFMDAQGRQYALWPPVQDWTFKTPLVIVALVELADQGKLEIVVEASNHEIPQIKS